MAPQRNLPLAALAVAITASIVLLLVFGSGLTFFQDEWDFVLHRRGFSGETFFQPHNEHIAIIPIALYKLALQWFGMGTTMPERVVAVLLIAATAALLFVYVRRRVGDWPALFAAVLVLFLGPAWQVLLWPFELMLTGSLAAGLGALLALEREDRRGDRIACALLVVAVLCSSLGIAFVLAAIVDLLQRRPQWRERVYVPAVPLVLYAVWWVAYGHKANSNVSLHNIVRAPVYLYDGVASALGSLLGLMPMNTLQDGDPSWVRWVLLALIVTLVLWLRRRGHVSRWIWVIGAAAAAYWLLAAINFTPGREAASSRYQLTGAVLLLAVLAELLRGARPSRAVLWGGALIVALATAANVATLVDGHRYMRQQTHLARADLAAIELARNTVDPVFSLTPDVAGTLNLTPIDAGSYLSAVDAFGSPAYTPAELAAASEPDRAQADVVLVHALPANLALNAAALAPGKCVDLPRGAAANGAGFRLRRGASVSLSPAPGPAATISLRRFATSGYPLEAGGVEGGTTAVLTIPADSSPRPWQVQVRAAQKVTVCGAAAT